ncbi:MAG: acyltransferase [Myxococcales bacterium]|nr:acyltransferase [Myxococcales bacterium]
MLAYGAARVYLAVAGWNTEGELPAVRKAILIAAPHTSAWDGPFMIAVAWAFRLRLHWLAKDTLFRGWRGPVLRWLGAIPVDRRAPRGQVADVVERFEQADAMILAIAPEGTRARTEHWKSGFYRMAVSAKVPIICGFLDYRRKVGGLGPVFLPTGDAKADMDRLREFYSGITGMRADGFAEPRLREEDPSAASKHAQDRAAE